MTMGFILKGANFSSTFPSLGIGSCRLCHNHSSNHNHRGKRKESNSGHECSQQNRPDDDKVEIFFYQMSPSQQYSSSRPPNCDLKSLAMSSDGERIHCQIDYVHFLVPDILSITNQSFYWGKIDRFEADRLLFEKADGTFLLRDSTQEEYLFSVSFRRFDRTYHARIEEKNHMFSFNSHDPGVFKSDTICGLIEHYKQSERNVFFEPKLTVSLSRTFPFSLQHIARAVICENIVYNSIDKLTIPKKLKTFLKEYHYKQQVRIKLFDS